MKRKIGIGVILTVFLMIVLFVFSRNPVVSSDIEIPVSYMEAVKEHAEGVYSNRLPLVPVYISIDEYSAGALYYTIYYFPFGTVGMSYIEGDGYNIEKPLTNMLFTKITGGYYMRKQKRWNIIVLTSLALIVMTGCGAEKENSISSEISKTIGVDVSVGEVISKSDSHGGFHGDGATVIEIQLNDTSISDQIKDNEDWNTLPLTENLTALVYGVQTESSSVGPMIHSGDGAPVIPEVVNGYYYFLDRHSQSTNPKDDSEVLNRASYNFTIAIFDTDQQTLYYMELDT